MKTTSLRLMLGGIAFAGVAAFTSAATAQEAPRYSYSPEYPPEPGYPQYPQGAYEPRYESEPEFVPPHQFFKMFGRRFGEMFRGMFYGDDLPQYPEVPGGRSLETPPSYGSQYGREPGISVPPEYSPAYPPRYQTAPEYEAAPRYENRAPRYEAPRYVAPRYEPAPPMQRSTVKPVPTPAKPNALPEPKRSTQSKTKAQSTPPKKYTPPTITRSTPPEPKVESSPPATAPETQEKKPAVGPGSSTVNKAGESSKGTSNSTNNGSFLKGKRTGKPGRVTSPYPPYQELDVTGLSSGSLALDPTTQKVFEVP